MKRSKFSEDQVAYALHQAESGTAVGDVCRQVSISEATFYAWEKKSAHLGVSPAPPHMPLPCRAPQSEGGPTGRPPAATTQEGPLP